MTEQPVPHSAEHYAREHSSLDGSELLVLECLARFDKTGWRCHPSKATIERETKLSRSTVQRVLRNLRLREIADTGERVYLPGNKGRYTVVYRLDGYHRWLRENGMTPEVNSTHYTHVDVSRFRKNLVQDTLEKEVGGHDPVTPSNHPLGQHGWFWDELEAKRQNSLEPTTEQDDEAAQLLESDDPGRSREGAAAEPEGQPSPGCRPLHTGQGGASHGAEGDCAGHRPEHRDRERVVEQPAGRASGPRSGRVSDETASEAVRRMHATRRRERLPLRDVPEIAGPGFDWKAAYDARSRVT
jgi:transposase